MPAEWRSIQLGDAVTFQRGFDLPAQDRVPGAVPIVSSSGVSGRHSQSAARGPGVVTGRYGTIGQVFFISEDYWPLNTTLWVKDFHGNHVRFMSYMLRTVDYWSCSDKSSVPGVNRNDLHSLPIRLPPLPEQRAIASVLGALDDKIDLNRRMCQTLEEMARALFKSWFVDFDPVRAKMEGRDPGLPKEVAELFPSRLVDSELGPIPEGWRVAALGEIAAPHRDLAQSNELDERTNYIGLEHMPRRSITLADWSTSEAVESSKFRFASGDILFGKLRPYFHKVGIAPTDGVCSTDIVVARPLEPETFGLTIGVMSSDAFVAHTDRSSAGTRMPRTNWADMSAFRIVTPNRDVAEVHTRAVKSMVDRIVLCIHETRTLAALRDTLLPKLISGELRVPASLGSIQEVAT